MGASRCSRSSSSAPASSSTPSRPPRPATASELGAALFNMLRCGGACLLAAVERDSYWAHMGWDADDAASHRDSSRLSSRLHCGHTRHALCPNCTGLIRSIAEFWFILNAFL